MGKKIKGLKKLNKTISAQFKPFGIKEVVAGDDYSYIFTKEIITYKITEDYEDKLFNEFIKSRFNYDCEYPFVISLLHEVGHHKANDEIDGDIYNFCLQEKERIADEMQDADEERSRELEFQYFNLPDEIMATQWAINWAKKHPKKVLLMWHDIQKALWKFYKKNLDEEEIAEGGL